MINQEIYEASLGILAQSITPGENEDYEERAPYLLAAFCNDVLDLDGTMRSILGEDNTPDFHKVFLPLNDEFPLLDRFAPLAGLYVASMLVLDENSELSDRIYDRYQDMMDQVRSGIPYSLESITDEYL